MSPAQNATNPTGSQQSQAPQNKSSGGIQTSVLISMAGFVLSIIILTFNACNKNKLFHEVTFDPRPGISDMLEKRIASIQNKIQELRRKDSVHEQITTPADKDKATHEKIRDSLNNFTNLLFTAQLEQQKLNYFNSDTSFAYFTNNLSVNRKTFLDALNSSSLKDDSLVTSVSFISVDTSYNPHALDIQARDVKLTVTPFSGYVSFFNKYPIIGYWFVLSIFQMTIWFLLLSLLFGVLKNTVEQVSGFIYSNRDYLKSCLVPLAALLLFAIAVYYYLIDIDVVNDQYFMNGFIGRTTLFAWIGYALATLYFGGYIYLAKKLEEFKKGKAKGLDLNDDANKKEKNEFIKLRSGFDFLFFMCAIILSLFVVWEGVLFMAVNSLESMKYYQLISGKQFLSNDFIYMIGLLHSLLLIIFYVPVHLKFKSMGVVPEKQEAGGTTGISSFFSTFFQNFGTVFITSAPFLTSLIQSFINNLVSNN